MGELVRVAEASYIRRYERVMIGLGLQMLQLAS
jgi:hypothetical protein